jgi:hypothetical protein
MTVLCCRELVFEKMIGILLILPFIIVESTVESFFDEGFESHLK